MMTPRVERLITPPLPFGPPPGPAQLAPLSLYLRCLPVSAGAVWLAKPLGAHAAGRV